MKFLTTVSLVIQLCLPVYGPGYFSELLTSIETNHTGFVCVHDVADPGHASRHDQQQSDHCRELDAPCDIPSGLALDHSCVVSTLTSSDIGNVLPGHGNPVEIPPEHHVKVRAPEHV